MVEGTTFRVENGMIYVVGGGIAVVKREHLNQLIETLLQVQEFEEYANSSAPTPFKFGDGSGTTP